MNKRILHTLLVIGMLTGMTNITQAQVTIGSGNAPAYGALLDIKSQQAGTVNNVGDEANITSTTGGLLLPRVKLTTFISLDPVVKGGDVLPEEDKLKLAGLMVYNINAVASILYLGVYVWNGSAWSFLVDSKVSSPMTAGEQPTEFSFYETGIAADKPAEALTFIVNPPKAADGTIGSVTYQWYQLVGNNLHATVGATIGSSGTVAGTGATTNSFIPTGVLKGATRNAYYTGFYRFYCEAKGSDGSSIRSNIVEVAVGCGAKDNLGDWITFMCFNLGADKDMTIEKQKTHTFSPYSLDASGIHEYVVGEEQVWGDLFQWGRIVDGHEKRSTSSVLKGALTDANIGNGNRCGLNGSYRPTLQIKKNATTWYGHFIHGDTNWATNSNQTSLDGLWRAGRYTSNDPCSKFKVDGTYQEFWHEGTDLQADSPACSDSGTAWRLPNQEEWGAIYKGGTLSGSPTYATANTWKWYSVESGDINLTKTRGFEIQPNGAITTLFLPISGLRNSGNGTLAHQGSLAIYWTSNTSSTNVSGLAISPSNVEPANVNYRSIGAAVRCIKN